MPSSARPEAAWAQAVDDASARRLQVRRRRFQIGFFVLFLVAPALDVLRFDVTEAQLWVLGMRWSLGIDALMQGQITPTE
ncbi:MAG TPA: hypothetical protein VFH49_16005, partial [Aquabacterium sp.]|nr:hypothetical protein [Aquabacterium sp.]